MKHHWVVGGVSAKLSHCTGLALIYPMENKIPFVYHAIEWWGCGYIDKDNKGLSESTRGHLMLNPNPSYYKWNGSKGIGLG